MKTLFFILLSFEMNGQTLDTEGFHLEWNHVGDKLEISLTAPTTGWVALGFTDGTGIVNTNLIQGCVRDGNVFVQDQFVTGWGEHPPVESLAIPSRISDFGGSQENKMTTISFSILKEKRDKLHFNLSEGRKINIWLAYSVEDDFDHHSRKRILRQITL